MTGVPDTDDRLLLLAPDDNVLVVREAIGAGEEILVAGRRVRIANRIGLGHKIARRSIPVDGKVVKYGAPIGSATMDIAVGNHVHVQNLKSDYTPTYFLERAP